MDYHVRHTVLPGPGNDQQLWEVVARLHANLLDRERPLWEFHLIEGLSDRRFAFYTKIHHAMADGVTINRWFTQAGSTTADDPLTPPIWKRDRVRPQPDPGEPGYSQLLMAGIKMLGGSIRTTFDLAGLGARLVQRRYIRGDSNAILPVAAPRSALNVTTGSARNLAGTSFPLALIRAIGKSQGASINDVLITLCDLAIGRYFADKGRAPEEPMVAFVPVNLRNPEDPENGNLVSMLQVRMAGLHDDPLAALRQIRESSGTARELFSGTGRSALQIYALMVALVAQFEESLKWARILPPTNNLVISNVPGPSDVMYFRGAETLAAFPISTLLPLTALNVTANSYAGHMHIGLVSGRTAIPDLQAIVGHLHDSVTALAAAAGIKTPIEEHTDVQG
jgi:diacylglycerol O-acyltransferase